MKLEINNSEKTDLIALLEYEIKTNKEMLQQPRQQDFISVLQAETERYKSILEKLEGDH